MNVSKFETAIFQLTIGGPSWLMNNEKMSAGHVAEACPNSASSGNWAADSSGNSWMASKVVGLTTIRFGTVARTGEANAL
jgi:hypothetical protein